MSPGFKAGSDDGIHAGLLKCCTLFGCGRRANRDDTFCPALFQDFPWRDPVDEAEHGYLLVQRDASLILKSYPRIGLVLWTRHSQCCDMGSKWLKASVERVFIRSSSTASSIDTHKFIANGFDVRERISAITSLIAPGVKL